MSVSPGCCKTAVPLWPWCVLLLGCGGDASYRGWDEVFVEVGSTALSESTMAEIDRSIAHAESQPVRLRGVNSASPYVATVRQGAEWARSVMGIPPAILETPYWGSIFRLVGAQSDGSIFAAVNLLYPIYVFGRDGALLDSLPNPPASWRQARRPRQGEFSSDDPEHFAVYLRSFTVITGLAATADSVLLVAHGEYRADAGSHGRWNWNGRHHRTTSLNRHGLAEATTVVDVYFNGRRVIADHAAPGEIFGSGVQSVFFLKPDPAGEGWLLLEFGVRPPP